MAFYPYYPQPLNPYPQTPVQPYQDRLAQLQNNYQQAMPYGQTQIQQPVQQMPQVAMLPGQMVDGIDTVKAKDVDMTGNPVYYPKTDGTEIYKKQLQADGKSRIFVYRIIDPDEQQQLKLKERNGLTDDLKNKIDIFFATGRITEEQYNELMDINKEEEPKAETN